MTVTAYRWTSLTPCYIAYSVCRMSAREWYLGRASTSMSRRCSCTRFTAWLPIKSRIQYEVLLLTYKCLHDLGPEYLRDLLDCYLPARRLRSAGRLLLRRHDAFPQGRTCILICRSNPLECTPTAGPCLQH